MGEHSWRGKIRNTVWGITWGKQYQNAVMYHFWLGEFDIMFTPYRGKHRASS